MNGYTRRDINQAVATKQDVRLSTGETMNPWSYSTVSAGYRHYMWWVVSVRQAIQSWKASLRGLNPDVRQAQILQAKINNAYDAISEYRYAMATRFELQGLGMFAKG